MDVRNATRNPKSATFRNCNSRKSWLILLWSSQIIWLRIFNFYSEIGVNILDKKYLDKNAPFSQNSDRLEEIFDELNITILDDIDAVFFGVSSKKFRKIFFGKNCCKKIGVKRYTHKIWIGPKNSVLVILENLLN